MSIFIVRAGNGTVVTGLQSKPSIGSIELDASISETHSFESIVPEYPVEDGTVITDTYSNKPPRCFRYSGRHSFNRPCGLYSR
jgi:hypothetical protein